MQYGRRMMGQHQTSIDCSSGCGADDQSILTVATRFLPCRAQGVPTASQPPELTSPNERVDDVLIETSRSQGIRRVLPA